MKQTPIKRKPCKLKPLDDLSSLNKRLMSGGYCKRCWLLGKRDAYKGYDKLHNAHFRSRRFLRTRWEYDNTEALCCGCHRYLDDNSVEKNEFFLEILGLKRYNEIIEQSRNGVKPDKEKIKAKLKESIKILEE